MDASGHDMLFLRGRGRKSSGHVAAAFEHIPRWALGIVGHVALQFTVASFWCDKSTNNGHLTTTENSGSNVGHGREQALAGLTRHLHVKARSNAAFLLRRLAFSDPSLLADTVSSSKHSSIASLRAFCLTRNLFCALHTRLVKGAA